jgi:hypothetical protein
MKRENEVMYLFAISEIKYLKILNYSSPFWVLVMYKQYFNATLYPWQNISELYTINYPLWFTYCDIIWILYFEKIKIHLNIVAHICGPSYLEGRGIKVTWIQMFKNSMQNAARHPLKKTS